MTPEPATGTFAPVESVRPAATGRSGALPPVQHQGEPMPPKAYVGVLVAVAVIALGLGLWSLDRVDVAKIGGSGLIEALPFTYFAALALSLTGFVASLNLHRLIVPLLAGQLLVLVVILHGANPIVHGVPRLQASYRHLGIADYIARTEQLDPELNAYFNWPGFFNLMAMLSRATGVDDLSGLATWAPLGVNILLLPALLALATRLTSQPRQAWAGVWLFYLASWVGQDYLAPQAYGFLLMLTMLACLLSVFTGWAWPPNANRFSTELKTVLGRLDRNESRQPAIRPSRADTAGLVVVCAILLLAITASHQLTPFAMIPILIALLLTGHLRLRFFPALAVMLPVCWLVFVASAYFDGHLDHLFGSMGNISAITSGGLFKRVAGTEEHVWVVYIRLAEAAFLWLLAILGAVVARRRGSPWLAAGAGAVAPLILIPAQPYGGELFLRLYLFILPFAACLAVLTIVPDRPTRPGVLRTVALLVLGGIFAAGTLVSRYGNDSMEGFRQDELALVSRVYSLAPPGSVLIAAVGNTPWQFQKYAEYEYRQLVAAAPGTTPLTCEAADQLARPDGAYVIVTESQRHAGELLGGTKPGDVENFVATCGTSPGWSKVAENGGGVVFHIEGVKNAR
jgi:hypothetical protein